MKNILLILLIFSINSPNVYSIEPDVFVQSTVNRASQILSKNISKEEAIQGVKHHLIESLNIRLRADVPIGFCLSGGIDSASIASIASKKFHTNIKTFSEKNLNKIFYLNGKEAVLDVIYFKVFKSSKVDGDLINLIDNFKDKEIPLMTVKANMLMEKYNIPEGKELGSKLKAIEEVWINNNFKISDREVQKIVSN